MSQPVPASLRWTLALIAVGTGLRLWAGIAVPVLDISDKGELWAALAAGLFAMKSLRNDRR